VRPRRVLLAEEVRGKTIYSIVLKLKNAKLTGQVSEARILAGSVATAEGSEIVEVGFFLVWTWEL
jgi:hypothetical protein